MFSENKISIPIFYYKTNQKLYNKLQRQEMKIMLTLLIYIHFLLFQLNLCLRFRRNYYQYAIREITLAPHCFYIDHFTLFLYL